MAASPRKDAGAADWLSPLDEQQGLRRYLTTLKERWWLVLLAMALTTGAATAYVALADKVYRGYADLLVTPVSRDDDTTLGLGLIRDSTDPTRDVSTAARLVTTIPVAQRVKRELGIDDSPSELLERVTAEPLAQSSVVTITADAKTPGAAARLANAFAEEVVELRTEQLRRQLDRTIPLLRERVEQLPLEQRDDPGGLAARLAALEALRGVPDPTIRVTTRATPPEQQSAPRPRLSIAAGLVAGLILGVGAAFGLQAIDPRLRREEQLRSLYRVPILARIPLERKTRKAGALAPGRLSLGASEAYRTLRATLAASRGAEFRARSVLVTGSSPSEGKTTTAINLAYSLVQAGNKVILIEADMHRPTIGLALGVRPLHGLASVLIRQVDLADALVTTDEYGPDLQLLLVDRPGVATADRLSLPTARQLVAEAEQLADHVVIDSPPLSEVVDALPLAQQVADVLVVARMGKSKLKKLTELGELLAHNEIQPAGVALVGVERGGSGYYYSAVADDRRAREREPAVGR